MWPALWYGFKEQAYRNRVTDVKLSLADSFVAKHMKLLLIDAYTVYAPHSNIDIMHFIPNGFILPK